MKYWTLEILKASVTGLLWTLIISIVAIAYTAVQSIRKSDAMHQPIVRHVIEVKLNPQWIDQPATSQGAKP